MAQNFSAEISTRWAQTRVFDYLLDFRHLPEWHPAVEDVELISLDHAVRNARYRVRAAFAGRTIEAEVVTVELERPTLIVASAENPSARTTDRFDVTPFADGTTVVRYSTELELKATLRVIGPLMVPALTSAWGRAVAGLEQILAEPLAT